MTRPTESYECFDVVIVPFPFTDKAQQKRRPALILSQAQAFGKIAGHSVIAMITSAKIRLTDYRFSPRRPTCPFRGAHKALHLFTLDKRGTSADIDKKTTYRALTALLGLPVKGPA